MEATCNIKTKFRTCNYSGVCKDWDVDVPTTFKNPCINSNYVRIVAPQQFAREEYILFSGTKVLQEHGEFRV